MTLQPFSGRFPDTRLRRARRHQWLRRAVAETTLAPADLVWPLFVHDHEMSVPVASMPGVERLPIEGILRAAGEALRLGIPAIAIFPVVESSRKTDDAAHAYDPENLACRTVRAIRRECGDALGIVCDVALDPYTSHGHDGLLKNGQIVNDDTVEVLCRQAVVLADAGCHVVAPSDLMDGRVGSLRLALDEHDHDDDLRARDVGTNRENACLRAARSARVGSARASSGRASRRAKGSGEAKGSSASPKPSAQVATMRSQ
jgi:porphobilinogen synthase